MASFYGDVAVIFCCCAFLSILYALVSPAFGKDEKKRAWIISAISSLILTIFGSFRVISYFRGDEDFSEAKIYSDNPLARFLVLFFFSTELTDLVIGQIYYRSQLPILTSYVHHICYMSFMLVLASHNHSNGFIYCFFEELPTFLLAIGILFPSYRNDWAFGISYFLIRILYHFCLILGYMSAMWESLYWRIATFVMIFHLYWMYKWTFSMYRRYKKNKKG